MSDYAGNIEMSTGWRNHLILPLLVIGLLTGAVYHLHKEATKKPEPMTAQQILDQLERQGARYP